MKRVNNIPASVHGRLLNRARSDKRPFNELLQYYAMERFLYRLSKSVHASAFILKGALMLRAWRSPEFRATMDIDMLGRTSNEQGRIVAQIQDMMAVKVEPDGLVFDPSSVKAEQITEEADYLGVRIRFLGILGSARVNMRVDIGFGDIVYPEPQESDLPAMLGFPPARLLCYSRESAIAEKFEAMVKRGILNSRMKDFYDIWLLARQFDFDGKVLREAIYATFSQRGTTIPKDIEAFTLGFSEIKQPQWSAFRKRLQQESIPNSFGDIVTAIEAFLGVLASSPLSSEKKTDSMRWIAARAEWVYSRQDS